MTFLYSGKASPIRPYAGATRNCSKGLVFLNVSLRSREFAVSL